MTKLLALSAICIAALATTPRARAQSAPANDRTRISLDDNWRFTKNDPPNTTGLLYDARPAPAPARGRGAPPPPASAPSAIAKSWILPTANPFLKDPAKSAIRPDQNLGDRIPYLAPDFDDSAWQPVNLPHDFAIQGPFTATGGGGMGRLPSAAVVWYRKNLSIPASDAAKSIFLDIDGAMSYSEVWLNGQFVGGWPYGYSSFRLNLTPYAKPGQPNTLAIRLDNPPNSSRWYPGGGLYRNVWLVETNPVHVAQWGTQITTPDASAQSAAVNLQVTVDNDSANPASVQVETRIYPIGESGQRSFFAVAGLPAVNLDIPAGKNAVSSGKCAIQNPKLWGVSGGDISQKPNRYAAITEVKQNGNVIDTYETPFGIRSLKFDPNAGFLLNGEHIKLNGVCNHHDLGALGAAINTRALERQLQLLAEMGCNAIRTSHDPPAPELLDLCDKMGFLVMDESFDCWQRQKNNNDYHLLFNDWHEPDLRALIRRDRNHPSVIMWSIGNEVGEQTDRTAGPHLAAELTAICHEEDPTRPTICAMNSAAANSPFPAPIDLVGLNYQGAGLFSRNPQFPNFHRAFPDKLILGSETTDAYSSRGYYTFPVPNPRGAVAGANSGSQNNSRQISSYDLFNATWSYVPDYEFAAQDNFSFVGGEFVWTGFDYLGEPSPFDQSRSSYCGILDLAGFKKDRFFLYQSKWRPDFPMAHILPHWNWPDRIGQVTPVHIYTSGDEAELFLNGTSLGKKKKAPGEFRIRFDDVTYQPGELHAIAYKDGKKWAEDTVKTTGDPANLLLTPDRTTIANDGKDLAFVTLAIADKDNQMVPRSMNPIHFTLTGPGEIVATDNGDPTDMTPFPSQDRKAFNGLALAIIRAKPGEPGPITLTAKSDGLPNAAIQITTNNN